MTTIALLWIGYDACKTGQVVCEGDNWPMISDVIRLHLYDRIMCIIIVFFTLAVQQVNFRANFRRLYGIIDQGTNDIMLLLGIVSCFALVGLTFFDDEEWTTVHDVIAAIFFGSTLIYINLMSKSVGENIHKFNEEET